MKLILASSAFRSSVMFLSKMNRGSTGRPSLNAASRPVLSSSLRSRLNQNILIRSVSIAFLLFHPCEKLRIKVIFNIKETRFDLQDVLISGFCFFIFTEVSMRLGYRNQEADVIPVAFCKRRILFHQ